eukprot:CAMPEP_0194501816 /NCGR_PEP_ID=MMETSP0253-20130528/23211_1 /TAXON_ID=2966 /ORGANISM="Noctiluca scintillans" /LENGTH=43 /DNA_ID= /DNA_START= /DNA_END= /DNA_ORIENTATION=
MTKHSGKPYKSHLGQEVRIALGSELAFAEPRAVTSLQSSMNDT